MRIRSIRPEFWRSDDIDRLDWSTRLIFIGLWSYVDDNGVGRDRMSDIAADLFAGDLSRDPRDTFARVSDGLQHLHAGGQITRYRVDERDYLHITSWDVHQKIDRPGKSRYPLPTCENARHTPAFDTSSRQSRETPSTGEGEKGRRGEGEELPRASAASREVAQVAAPAGAGAMDGFEEFWSAYPRKQGKEDARKAWRQMKCSGKQQAVTDGAQRYASDPNREDRYTKLPAGWLREGRWEDAALPARGPRTKAEAEAQAKQERRQRWLAEAQAADDADRQHLALVQHQEDPWTA